MKFKTGIAVLTLYVGTSFATHAQEVLLPAGISPKDHKALKSVDVDFLPDTLELPFFDDFSRQGDTPYPYFWTDRFANVNNTYTRNPVTLGVATMDAVDSEGALNGSSSFPFVSDFLTSVPINLDYPGRQDIWLSFFYEPMGLGDVPEEPDSLALELFAPDSNRWERVWSSPGFNRDSIQGIDTFRQVFIPVREERFLKKGFQFRFLNYASFSPALGSEDQKANVDHWNIDYVYLDTARSQNVTAVNDVSMIASPGSILKSYQSIPWSHFGSARVTELRPWIEIRYRNNDTIVRSATRVLKITDLNYLYSESENGGADNIIPGALTTFMFPIDYPFQYYDEFDSAVFEIKSYLVTEALDYKWNDTVVRYQCFYNYYAYDDGSAENGYGLKGIGTSNASVACRFKTFRRDTLRGVQFCFNRTVDDYSQDYFKLAVWEHDNILNAPGKLIYSMTGVKPEYEGGLNGFQTYLLDTVLVVSDYFYVGWIKTTENMLNVGWDVWNNHRNEIFYNLGQEWINTRFSGSLMLRPLMGRELSWPASAPEIPEPRIRVYPNPASEVFYLELPPGEAAGEWTVNLYNLQGKLVYSGRSTEGQSPHYTGELPGGLYIVRVSRNGIFRASSKIMILR